MTCRKTTATADFDEETLSDTDCFPSLARDGVADSRETCFLDFKDGPTEVTVIHGPPDPSRICINVRDGRATLQLSFEEGVGRRIAEGLARVLPTFRAVRSRIR